MGKIVVGVGVCISIMLMGWCLVSVGVIEDDIE